MNLNQHHAHAQRKAKYGHRHWIVWEDVMGKPHSAQATAENLQQAIADVQGRKFSGYSPSTGIGNVLSRNVADVWLSNARQGCLR